MDISITMMMEVVIGYQCPTHFNVNKRQALTILKILAQEIMVQTTRRQ
jgi:hypothetical protein